MTMNTRTSNRQLRLAFQAALLTLVVAASTAGGSPVDTNRIVDVSFYSAALRRNKTYTVVIPPGGGPAPVLFLLHGRGRNHRSLVDRTDTRASLLAENYFIVLPDGEDGWYIDSPVNSTARYGAYLEEVVHSAESNYPVAREPARRALAGWSMGGYGAAHFATTHPGGFAALVSIVGLLDFPRPETLPSGRNYRVPEACFGVDPMVWRALNPIEHITALAGMRVLAITGSDSFDLIMNREFVERARECGLDCHLIELAGGHTIETVAEALPSALEFVRTTFAAAAPATVTAGLTHLPRGQRTEQYASRDEFLKQAAAFETERLHSQPWRFDGEEAFFTQGEVRTLIVGDRLELRFRRVAPAAYCEGISPYLKRRLLDIPNRNHDQHRWTDMFDPERRDLTRVAYDYFISDKIISNSLFAAFVRGTGYRTTVERYATGWVVDAQAQWRQGFANAWDQQIYPTSEPDHPVVQVSWFDAMQFAAWLNARYGVALRVPTKKEWLLAAHPANDTGEPRLFPWGNTLENPEQHMNFGTAELTDYAWIHQQFRDGYARSSPVDVFPPNVRGLYDMLGNVWVWNWTNASAYTSRPWGDRTASPSPLTHLGTIHNAAMTMTGGCYLARLSHANLLAQMSHPALDGAEDIGFRLVAVRRRDSGLVGEESK